MTVPKIDASLTDLSVDQVNSKAVQFREVRVAIPRLFESTGK